MRINTLGTFCLIFALGGRLAYPSSERFNYRTVESEVQAGQYGAAKHALEERLKTAPRDFRAHLLMGIVLDLQDHPSRAANHLKEAVRLRPNDSPPRIDLGKFEAEHGRLQEAATDFQAALHLDPGNATAHYNLAVVLARQGEDRRALAEFKRTTELLPRDYLAWLGAFRAEMSLREYNPAHEIAKKVVKLAPPNTNPDAEIGAIEAAAGDYQNAIENLHMALSRAPDSYPVLYNLGLAYYRSGSIGPALQVLEALAAKTPRPELEDLLGDVYEKDREYVRAARAFEDAKQMAPRIEQYRVDFILELLAHRNFAAAIVEAQSGLRTFPTSLKLLLCLGVSDFGAGHYSDAKNVLLRCVGLFPDAGAPLYLLLQIEQSAGSDLGNLDAVLERYCLRHPDQFWPYYFRGLEAFRKGQESGLKTEYVQSESLLRRCVATNPMFAECHFSLGDVFSALNQWQDAVREYRKTVDLDPLMAKAHYRLAIAYQRIGKTQLAKAEVRTQQGLARNARGPDLKAQQVDTFVYQIRK